MDALRRSILMGPLVLAAASAAVTAGAQTPAPVAPNERKLKWPSPSVMIDLWPGIDLKAPAGITEVVEETTNDPKIHFRRLKGVVNPRLAVFPAQKPNGGAMLIIPGGGFSWNYFDHEGYQLADFLNGQGITCFVLFYRLANDGWADRADVGLIDAQRAMRVIRQHAAHLKIDPARVGVTGFSAGGFLTASLATRYGDALYGGDEGQDARPFLAAPIYPVQSLDPAVAYVETAPSLFQGPATPDQVARYSPERRVDSLTPPVFLVHAEDDLTVPVENSTRLRDALKIARVPVETHLFATGGHGFGMKPDLDQPYHVWPQLLASFARRQGLMG